MKTRSILSVYIASVAVDFKISSYRTICHDESIISAATCNDVEHGVLFDTFPMRRKLNQTEFRRYVDEIKKLMKGRLRLYSEQDFPRKVRLSKEYPHKNTLCLKMRDTKCVLCGHLLGDNIRSTTIKSCDTCHVPLYSANSANNCKCK